MSGREWDGEARKVQPNRQFQEGGDECRRRSYRVERTLCRFHLMSLSGNFHLQSLDIFPMVVATSESLDVYSRMMYVSWRPGAS